MRQALRVTPNIHTPNEKSSPSLAKILAAMLVILLIVSVAFSASTLGSIDEEKAQRFYQDNYFLMTERYRLDGFNDYKNLYTDSLKDAALAKLNYVTGQSRTPKINIEINFRDLKIIQEEKEHALPGLYQHSDRNYASGTIQYQDSSIPVELRYDSDNENLKDPKKWSLRLKAKGEERFLGMKNFLLRAPDTRGYQYEPVFHQSMRDAGLAAVRYGFVDLSINGASIGLMAFEELFTAELLESQRRPDGVILSLFSERMLPASSFDANLPLQSKNNAAKSSYGNSDIIKQLINRDDGVGAIYMNALNTPVSTFEETRIVKSTLLQKQRAKGVGLLRSAIHGILPIEEVFSPQIFGRFLATQWMWGSFSAAKGSNLRLFLNPFTFQFEPISFNSGAVVVNDYHSTLSKPDSLDNQIFQMLLNSPTIMSEFRRYSTEMKSKIETKNYLEHLAEIETEHLKTLRQNYALLPPIPFSTLKKRVQETYSAIQQQNYFKSISPSALNISIPPELQLPEIVLAYLVKTKDRYQIEFANLLPDATDVNSLTIKVNGVERPTKDIIDQQLPMKLSATSINAAPTILKIELNGVNTSDLVAISGTASPKTQQLRYNFKATPYYPMVEKHPLAPEPLSTLLDKYRFFKFTGDGKTLTISRGSWNINEMMVIPSGLSLQIEAGTELRFAPSAGIIIRGATKFQGSPDAPIMFDVQKGSSENWRGITILSAEERSNWKYVQIKNTRNAAKDGWELSAGVTFYQSPVSLYSVQFENSSAQDALNIVDTEFSMDRVVVKNTMFDGFDGDFVNGSIRNSSFRSIGGNAIDLNGANVTAAYVKCDGITGKAISASQSSKIKANNIRINNAGIGVTSKDSSHVHISESILEKIKHSSFVAYVKKRAFGGASILAESVIYPVRKDTAIAQIGSSITINRDRIISRELDVESALIVDIKE